MVPDGAGFPAACRPCAYHRGHLNRVQLSRRRSVSAGRLDQDISLTNPDARFKGPIGGQVQKAAGQGVIAVLTDHGHHGC